MDRYRIRIGNSRVPALAPYTEYHKGSGACVAGLEYRHDRQLESIFFRRQRLGISTIAAASMIVTSAEFVRQAKRVDPVASRARIPLVAWVAFATVLTATIWS